MDIWYKTTLPPAAFRRIIIIALAVFAAYLTLFSLGNSLILKDRSHSSAIVHIDRTVEQPFIQRALVPWIAQGITAIMPQPAQESISVDILGIIDSTTFQRILKETRWQGFTNRLATPYYICSLVVIALCMYAGFVVYGITLYRLSEHFFGQYRLVPGLTALFGLIMLLPFAGWRFQIYDAPALAFSALCFFFMLKQRWLAYIVCFALACLNKETIALYTLVFTLIYYRRMERPLFTRLLAAQLGLWSAIMAFMWLKYASLPVDERFTWRIFATMDRFDKNDLAAPVLIFVALFARWPEIPLALKRALVLLPIGILGYYTYGMYREYRIMFDSFPIVALIIGYTLFTLIEPAPAGRTPPAGNP